MRSLLLAVLITGCSEHGSAAPDALIPDGKPFFDAPVTTCFAPDGSANVTVSGPGPTGAAFSRIYAGGVLLSGPFAPAKSTGAPFELKLLVTNVAQADLGILGVCDGTQPSCTTDGLAVTTTLERDAEVGTHPVSIRGTTGTRPSVQGTMTVTEFVHPFATLPGHITGTVSSSGAITASGSFSTVFCPPFLAVTI